MKLAYMQPHMHLRGKDFEMRLVFPSGETRTVLKGRWNFDWHLGYDLAEPIDLPVGHADHQHLPLRQLGRQQVQPGSEQARLLGRSELGRDAEHLHRRAGRSGLDQRTFFKASGPSLLKRARLRAQAVAARGSAGRQAPGASDLTTP